MTMRLEPLGRRSLLSVSLGGAQILSLERRNLNESNPSTGTTIVFVVVSVLLVVFSGICAGLTLGLLSLDR